jgi:hypothetical protein
MGKTVAIVQSNYIPWRGYFDLINSVDEFILYDDMQYTIRDWRNRNIIKTANGPLWLSIPVQVKGKYFQKIKDTIVSDPQWAGRHWATIRHSYSKAKCFSACKDLFAELYEQNEELSLSLINHRFICAICRFLGINTRISWSMDYEVAGEKTEKLVNLCKQAGATHYLSGPAARSYLVEDCFKEQGITVSFMDYSGYPEYNQLYPPFEPAVSVVDLILNEGAEARAYLKSFQR